MELLHVNTLVLCRLHMFGTCTCIVATHPCGWSLCYNNLHILLLDYMALHTIINLKHDSVKKLQRTNAPTKTWIGELKCEDGWELGQRRPTHSWIRPHGLMSSTRCSSSVEPKGSTTIWLEWSNTLVVGGRVDGIGKLVLNYAMWGVDPWGEFRLTNLNYGAPKGPANG